MKNIKYLWQIFLIVLGIFSSSMIFAASFSNPVIDQTHTLSQEEQRTLNKKLWHWYDQGLMQGAVVMVKTTGSDDIFDYGMDIFERWKLGNKKNDNGLLIVIAKEDHKIRIITGYGLEGALPDISVKRIIDQNITPEFKKNAYFQGIENGLMAITEQLNADPEVREEMIAHDKARANKEARENIIGEVFAIFIIGFNALLNLILNKIKTLKENGGRRFIISLISVTAIASLVAFIYDITAFILIPPAIMAIIIGSAIGNKNKGGRNFRTSHYVFPRDDDYSHFSRSSERHYSGGGGNRSTLKITYKNKMLTQFTLYTTHI